jgi:hypothetical protein
MSAEQFSAAANRQEVAERRETLRQRFAKRYPKASPENDAARRRLERLMARRGQQEAGEQVACEEIPDWMASQSEEHLAEWSKG